MSDITLSSSMRSNLLSLQQTSVLQDQTSQRLSTGLKINSAIDNPSSYYTSSGLENRAADLSSLLDSMSQGISSLQATTQGIESGTGLLEQASAVAVQAALVAPNYDGWTQVSNETELRDALTNGEKNILITKSITFPTLTGSSTYTASLTLDSDVTLAGISKDIELNFSENTTTNNQYGINMGDNSRLENLTVNFTGYDSEGINNAAVRGNGVNFELNNVDVNTSGYFARGVYYGGVGGSVSGNFNVNAQGSGSYGVYLIGSATIKSGSVINATSENSYSLLFYSVNNTIESGVELWLSDSSNSSGQMKQYVTTSDYTAGTSSASYIPLTDAEFLEFATGESILTADFLEEMAASEDSVDLSSYSDQYNSVLSQYNLMIKDSSYNGRNLLSDDNLTVYFNEDRSSGLDIKGVDASANGVGLSSADWQEMSDVLSSINQLTDAINTMRQYSTDFGNAYSLLENREDFTEKLINILTSGSDKLTLADMNEESANMLALQTRQQLATNALSLASQAVQNTLKLF